MRERKNLGVVVSLAGLVLAVASSITVSVYQYGQLTARVDSLGVEVHRLVDLHTSNGAAVKTTQEREENEQSNANAENRLAQADRRRNGWCSASYGGPVGAELHGRRVCAVYGGQRHRSRGAVASHGGNYARGVLHDTEEEIARGTGLVPQVLP